MTLTVNKIVKMIKKIVKIIRVSLPRFFPSAWVCLLYSMSLLCFYCHRFSAWYQWTLLQGCSQVL